MSIRKLIDIYNELNNAIFFDGLNEFLRNENCTDEEWKDKANQFLDEYQRLLTANATVAKYDYFLHEKERDELAEYRSMGIDLAKIDLAKNRPDEPFEDYFELMRKMAIPIAALRKTLDEIGDYSISNIPIINESIKELGVFTFIVNDKKVQNVQYRGKTLKLQPKDASTFFCIMRRRYDDNSAISMDEIREYNKKPADSEKSIRSQVSKINRAVRDVANLSKDDKLIINANEIAPCMFKLDVKLLARI